MDAALNVGFFAFHTLWIAFNLVGWIGQTTRPWHLAAVSLTALSWFGLGIWYGWGYCPCTDWHWDVRARLGLDSPPSYVQLLIREVMGIDVLPRTADILTLAVFLAVAWISVALNIRDHVRAEGKGQRAEGGDR
jgi:hypothetical protein